MDAVTGRGLPKRLSGDRRLGEAKKRPEVERGRPCPECKSPTDDYGRCLECGDWLCRWCGRATGSFLISQCQACVVELGRGGG